MPTRPAFAAVSVSAPRRFAIVQTTFALKPTGVHMPPVRNAAGDRVKIDDLVPVRVERLNQSRNRDHKAFKWVQSTKATAVELEAFRTLSREQLEGKQRREL